MATASLLIVDDDADRASSLVDRVKSEAWSTSVASGVEEARTAVDSTPVSLALADAGVWRAGLAAHVAQKHPALPVIVLTAQGDAAVQHLQLGAMTFLPRDAGRRRLVETVQSILDLTRRNPYREGVRGYLRAAEVELHLGNDPAAVGVVVGYVQRILEDYGLSNPSQRFRVGLALSEAVSNAMIHGNLEVSSDRRGDGDVYYDLIEGRRRAEPYASRTVQVVARFSQSSATFVVRDQGKGFDPAGLPDPTDPENLLKPCGRGVLLMRAYTDLVTWNETGNEVTLVKSLTAALPA